MDTTRRFIRFWNSGAAALGSVGALYFKHWATSHLSQQLAWFLAALIVATLTFCSDLFASWLIDNSKFLRRKLWRHRFVEGLWKEAILVTKGPERVLRGVALVTIGYAEGSPVVSGDVFLCDGSPDGNFTSVSASYRDSLLNYSYKGVLVRKGDSFGHGHLSFTRPPVGEPITFQGKFSGEELDYGSLHVFGDKVVNDAEIRRAQQPEDRDALIREVVEHFKERFPDYRPLAQPPADSAPIREGGER
ncbi:MAG: hypothetical protein AAGN46_04905 [Acidobacteriota bacterium]